MPENPSQIPASPARVKPWLLAIAGLCSILILAACGQRGPLYLPDQSESLAPPVEEAGADDPTKISDEDDGGLRY